MNERIAIARSVRLPLLGEWGTEMALFPAPLASSVQNLDSCRNLGSATITCITSIYGYVGGAACASSFCIGPEHGEDTR